jgi:AraC-like DNA-binding protein
MMNCETVGRALETFFRYHGLMADFVSAEMIPQGVYVKIRLQPAFHPISLQRHHTEAIFGIICSLLRHLTGGAGSPAEVRFIHHQPEDVREHRRVFGSVPRFGHSRNELLLRRQELDAPVLLADPELLERLEPVAHDRIFRIYRPDSWSERVAQTLQRLLAKGEKPGIEQVASELAVGTRSLQNRLKEEGTSYREILDHARKELALDYLKKPGMPLCDIAFLLGFSEQSTFNHAFQRWTGRPPGQFRKKKQGGSARSRSQDLQDGT